MRTFDSFAQRPLAGLPVRMVFTCRWHVTHAWLIGIGFCIAMAGQCFQMPLLQIAGVVLVIPSLACFALLILALPLPMACSAIQARKANR